MGIKGWLTVGGVVLTGIAVWLGLKKKEDEHYEKIQKLIRDVDRKELEKKEETTEKIIDDIEQSFRDMGLNNEADAYAQASEAIMDMVAKELGNTKEEMIQQGKTELEKLKGKGMDEILKMQEEFNKQHPYAIIRDGVKIPATKEEWDAECQRLADEAAKEREERLQNGEWLKEVQEAAKIKSFSKLEDLLNEKYNPYPYHPAPSDPYGQGYREGVIDEKTYKAAQKYYGRLWNYSGD